MHQDILSENDRKVLATFLQNNAPDDILLAAVNDVKRRAQDIREDLTSLSKYIGPGLFNTVKSTPPTSQPVVKTTEASPTTTSVKPQEVKLAVNEEWGKVPPGTAAKRVRSNTQSQIERLLEAKPLSAAVINASINGTMGNTVGVLKLLWERKVLVFNGTEYKKA